jgi:hypothetical protein
VRGIFALAALLFNSLMLTLTAKALQLCSTTVQSVVTTSAVNFLISVNLKINLLLTIYYTGSLTSSYIFILFPTLQGLLGTFLLGEDLGFLGVVGMIFIQIGVLIISNEKEKTS